MVNRQRQVNDSQHAVSFDELELMIGKQNVLLLDVRTMDEFASGHITGALSIPLEELMARLKDLTNEKEIIAYCRGPFCMLADEAVKLLKENGYKARRLDGNYPEWKIRQMKLS